MGKLTQAQYIENMLETHRAGGLKLGVFITYMIMTHSAINPHSGSRTAMSIMGHVLEKFGKSPQIGTEILLGLRKFDYDE